MTFLCHVEISSTNLNLSNYQEDRKVKDGFNPGKGKIERVFSYR